MSILTTIDTLHVSFTRILPCLMLIILLLTGCFAIPKASDSSSTSNNSIAETGDVDSASDNPQPVEITAPELTTPLSLSASLPLGRLDTKICKTQVTNAPDAINQQISRASAAACVNGVAIMVNPAPEACLTSGFGNRNGRAHAGVDYQSKPAGKVVAAARGTVVTKGYRAQDYGNWVVISHGSDVYTAYAHLASIDEKIKEGQAVEREQVLGVMGKTGPSWINAIHLHYEVRTGNLAEAGSYFNLEAVNPYKKPEFCSAS